MPAEPVYDVFVSYRWTEPDRSWVRDELLPALRSAGVAFWHDDALKAAGGLLPALAGALNASRRGLCVLSPEYLESEHTLHEAQQIVGRDPAGKKGLVVLVVLRPTEVPSWLSIFVRVDLTDEKERRRQWRKLLEALGAPNPEGPLPGMPGPGNGIAPREVVFEREARLPDQEFAIELLTQPVMLRRNRSGGVTVTINRDHVKEALYNTAGKRELCRRVFSDPARLAAARQRDAELHAFLLGRLDRQGMVLSLKEWPLRWASGGVLSVVRWRDRLWTPFFFRDIPPYGWNISLGASERGDDLDDPWTFQMREFLEETLVLDEAPQAARPIDYKRFVFDRFDIANEAARAEAFAARHIEARRQGDGLDIRTSADRGRLHPRFRIRVDLLPTDNALEIQRQGESAECPNVLVALNLLELGIEVVKVARYTLEDDDYLLDGELLDLDTHRELVRMPMALIAHDYLATAFQDAELRYLGDSQPSVEGPPIPADCIHLFEFDARRRWQLAKGLEPDASPWELDRYAPWIEDFGASFFAPDGAVTSGASTWFTPTSAKIVSYFFAGLTRR